jgi:hypothetical protein
MRSLLFACLSLGVAVACWSSCAAESDADKIDRLIRQLGSDKFAEREAAGKALMAVGTPALDALRKAARDSDDPEVRRQAALIADTIGAGMYERALAAVKGVGGRVFPERDGGSATAIDLATTMATDADLTLLGGFKDLSSLDLSGTAVTDAGLAHLKRLHRLQTLDLCGTKVTGAGLAHLGGLELSNLDLSGTRVTDAGLGSLKGLGALHTLDLSGTGVTDAGLVHLKRLTGVRALDLSGTKVTDAGLVHLDGCAELGRLDLSGTAVTDAGLAHLKKLNGLRMVLLKSTKVTAEGAADLMKALPELKIHMTE